MRPTAKKLGGQKVLEYEDHLFFILENGLYQMAGSKFWPEKELSGKGIGLNRKLYRKVMTSEKDFVVFDAVKECLYQLRDYQLVTENIGMEEMGSRKVFVTPLDAYEKIPVPRKLIQRGMKA